MVDFFGNKTEEMILSWLDKLDSAEINIGPAPFKGVEYEDVSFDELAGCDLKLTKDLMKKPRQFFFDENDEIYVLGNVDEKDEFDNRVYLSSDDTLPDFEVMCEVIQNRIPEPTFSVSNEGSRLQQIEAIALFKVLVVNKIYDNEYEDEIKKILSTYDFNRMCDEKGDYPFQELLKEIQETSGRITKVILMCCSVKLKNFLQRSDSSFKAYLSEEDGNILKKLREEDSDISLEFDTLYSNAKTAKQKIEIGDELERRRMDMLENIPPDKVLLFKISKLDLNAVPELKRRRLRREAIKFVSEINVESKILDSEQERMFVKKLVLRAQRLYLRRMKVQRYKLFAQGVREGLLPNY